MGAQETLSITDYEDAMPYYEYIYEQFLCEDDDSKISFGTYFYKHQDMEIRKIYKAQCLTRGMRPGEVDDEVIEEYFKQHHNTVEIREADKRMEFNRARKFLDESI